MSNTIAFTKIEFLLILISFVYGFCVVDLFDNWGRMLRRNIYYWETIIWSIILFLSIAFLWHNAWGNLDRLGQGSLNYILALLPPIFFFILTSLLFPDWESDFSLEAHFLKNRKRFFLTFAGVLLMVLATSNLTSSPKPFINASRSFFLAGTLVLAFIDEKRLRLIMAIVGFLWFGYLLTDPYSD